MKNYTDLTIDTYNAIANDYESNGFRFSAEEELRKFIKLLKPKSRILDAGCGFGRELLYFTEHEFDTYGIDASKELLKLAQKRAPKAKVQLADLRNALPFEDDYFDGVWARNSLHHLESKNLRKALEEIKRVLKTNGILFVEWKEGEGEIVTKEEFIAGQERFYNLLSKEKVIELVESAGFEILESYVYNWSERYNAQRQYSNFIVVLARKNQ